MSLAEASIPGRLEQLLEKASANIKLVDEALSGMEGSYVELLTVLALGLLAVIPVIVPQKRRQLCRHLTQLFGIFIFVFVVFTCLGVFGMIRNFHRGLMEIGRENIIALYFCSVPATILATSMIFGPSFCGWICPTGALQEFAGFFLKKWHLKRRHESSRFSWKMLAMAIAVALVFLAWMIWLSATRVFFVEDASIYWSEVLVLLLFVLVWRMDAWDGHLRRLRVLSFLIIVSSAIIGWRITSPVHFGFTKVYDPASILATVIVVLAALVVPHIWCRYLCPWREAIAWAGKHSVRKLVTQESQCNDCGKCNDVCSLEAIKFGEINLRECHFCLKCVDNCPQNAISVQDKWKAQE